MSASHGLLSLVGRVLLAAIFVFAGYDKFTDPASTIGYMQTSTFPIPRPDLTVYAVAAMELFGGLAILAGWCSRLAAFALALFSVAAAIGFHSNFGEPIQIAMFFKNLAIAGGLLLLAANGPGSLSISRG